MPFPKWSRSCSSNLGPRFKRLSIQSLPLWVQISKGFLWTRAQNWADWTFTYQSWPQPPSGILEQAVRLGPSNQIMRIKLYVDSNSRCLVPTNKKRPLLSGKKAFHYLFDWVLHAIIEAIRIYRSSRSTQESKSSWKASTSNVFTYMNIT